MKINGLHNRRLANLILIGYIVFLFFLNAYQVTYNFRPFSLHQWRQTDCLSITKNYYEQGMHFFHPEIHWQGAVKGKAVSECPILNYTVAAMWKIFGEHEFIYRLLEYFILIVAILFLFNALLKYSNSFIFSFFSASLLLTSPLLVYYGLNFIADVPALSLCIISFCFCYRFYNEKKISYFFLSIVFGTLAALLKAVAGISLGFLLFFSFADIFGLTGLLKTEKLFKNKIMPLVVIILAIILVFAWYRFAIIYNTFNNGVFLLTVLPIWEMKEDAIVNNLRILMSDLFPTFFNRPVYTLFFIMVFYVIANFKLLNSFFKYVFIFSFLFFILFLLVFFQVFTVHDYYLTNLMIFPVAVFFCIAHILNIKKTIFLNNRVFLIITVLIMVVFNSMYSAAVYRSLMIKDDNLVQWYPFITPVEKSLSDWRFWHYNNTYRPLETIRPKLREAGIKREDKVIIVPDESPNISLYFMDQKGQTISGDDFSKDTVKVYSFLNQSRFDYLVISDTTLKRSHTFKSLEPRLHYILTYSHVEVYKIKK